MQKITLEKTSRLNSFFEFVKAVAVEFYKDNGFICSSSLVYSTLMSLVPFIAVITSLFTAFGGVHILESSTIEWLGILDSPMEEKIFLLVNQFISNANSLGIVGLISFFITAIFLMNKIWSIFNSIFRSTAQRSQLKRFASYLTNLVVGTILISISMSISTIIKPFLPHFFDVESFSLVGYSLIPIAIIYLLLFLLLETVPATKVNFRSAALGSFFGTLFWQIINGIFQNTSLFFTKNTTIYGSFAFLFIFLLWIYFLWVGILLSVEITYVHQYGIHRTRNWKQDSPAYTISLAAATMVLVCQNYKKGHGFTTFNEIGHLLQVPDKDISRILNLLESQGFLIRGDGLKWEYIPARMVNDILMEDFIKAIYGETPEGFSSHLSETLLKGGLSSFHNKSFLDYLNYLS